MEDHTQLLRQVWMSAALIAATTFVHALFVAIGAGVLRASVSRLRGVMRILRDAVALVLLAVWLMAAHAAEIALWAWLFIALQLFESLELALYFAAVSYTTLGFGDVVLPTEWGLLSGAAAANGLLLFGLSAASLVEGASNLRLSKR